MLLASLVLASAMALQGPDTTFTVSQGDRLRVSVHQGSIEVSTWARNAVRIQSDMDMDEERLSVERSGGTITVEPEARNGPSEASLSLTVPAWMALSLDAVDGDISVRGAAATVSAETVHGDVEVTGGKGNVSLTSVDGTVTLTGASGSMSLSSVNDDITVRDAAGPVSASAVNGGIALSNVQSDNVSVESVNGDVSFGGPIQSGGRYSLSTHNGDVVIGVQQGASATVAVRTYSGDLETDFPVSVQRTRERKISFVLGSGSARLELESFQGTIHLVRPDKVTSR